jgi:hypothetical protein
MPPGLRFGSVGAVLLLAGSGARSGYLLGWRLVGSAVWAGSEGFLPCMRPYSVRSYTQPEILAWLRVRISRNQSYEGLYPREYASW